MTVSHHSHAAPMPHVRFVSRGSLVLMAIAATGAVFGIWRFAFGLAATTHLTDTHPWGIWIAIDVATGVALAAGGFTSSAMVHIFHRGQYHALVRPALLTALLGYTFVSIGLMADLGRYYTIWHPLIMWQGNSVLFEVGICVMSYLTVLYLEFAPIVLEWYRAVPDRLGRLGFLKPVLDPIAGRAERVLGRVLWVLIILGVVLSCMHQSSLGSLMLIAPSKVHPLWYTPVLPALFLLSAICVGLPMVVFESVISAWAFGRKAEMELLTPVTRFVPVFLGLYLTAKIVDLAIRGVLGRLAEGSLQAWAFLVEVGLGVALPLGLLLSAKVRSSARGLFVACALVVAGVALNRINVFLIAYQPPYAQVSYFPAIGEVAVTAGLIATLILAYRFAAIHFPVLAGSSAQPE